MKGAIQMKKQPILILFLCGVLLCSCGAKVPAAPDSFASMYFNTTDTMLCYKSLNGKTHILEYESMEDSLLCNKPNCTHNGSDCIVARLGGNIPIFSDTYAYYFIDDSPSIEEGEDGKPFLKLGTTLCRFDLTANAEEKLLHIDGVSASFNDYGWLLHDGAVWFIGNHYSPKTDENGILTSYGITGGKMELYSVDLKTQKISNYGDLYNVEELTKYYPKVPNSSEVYMCGVFDGKIYFNVAFVASADEMSGAYVNYVTYFDLQTKTYHGEPEDYENIDYSTVSFVSDDYLILTKDGTAEVCKTGAEEPVTISDTDIYAGMFIPVSAFDDTLFCCGKAYDLNTKKCIELTDNQNMKVIAAYQDSYIIGEGGQSDFKKVKKADFLAGKAAANESA